MIEVYSLGKNLTILVSMEGPVYKYQYKRSINNGATYTSFSNDLDELKKRCEEEKIKYGSVVLMDKTLDC
jgi:hypothetical protein